MKDRQFSIPIFHIHKLGNNNKIYQFFSYEDNLIWLRLQIPPEFFHIYLKIIFKKEKKQKMEDHHKYQTLATFKLSFPIL